jgi:hypothetical protein
LTGCISVDGNAIGKLEVSFQKRAAIGKSGRRRKRASIHPRVASEAINSKRIATETTEHTEEKILGALGGKKYTLSTKIKRDKKTNLFYSISFLSGGIIRGYPTAIM